MTTRLCNKLHSYAQSQTTEKSNHFNTNTREQCNIQDYMFQQSKREF